MHIFHSSLISERSLLFVNRNFSTCFSLDGELSSLSGNSWSYIMNKYLSISFDERELYSSTLGFNIFFDRMIFLIDSRYNGRNF